MSVVNLFIPCHNFVDPHPLALVHCGLGIMIEAQYLVTLHNLYSRLKDCNAIWVITGSVGMALQGLDLEVHDIDIQTDRSGAFEIESRFSENILEHVRCCPSERISSYFGKLEINGIQVEIMGDLQKRIDENNWYPHHRQSIENVRKYIERDREVQALLLCGSSAHGFESPASDIIL